VVPGRRRWPILGAIGVIVAAVVVAAALGADASPPPTRAELLRIQARIDKAWIAGTLARQGIFVMTTGPRAARCVSVEVANPTAPNRQYLERRFGPHVCVKRRPGGFVSGCSGVLPRATPPGTATVPDISELTLYEAEQRLAAAHLTWSSRCIGDAKRVPEQPGRYTLERLMHVTAQCPQPGENVPPGTEVALGLAASLAGGFQLRGGPLAAAEHRCSEGRNPG
jgi:hypothetical protein